VLVMDAEIGITEQDKKIADIITEKKKSCILVVNKWDLVEEEVRQVQREESERLEAHPHGHGNRMVSLAGFAGWVQDEMFFLDYAPVIFTSAKTGFCLDRLLEAVRYVAAQMQQKIPTALLNRVLNDAIEIKQPVSNMGHRLKFFYATQVKQTPPTFVLFVNRQDLLSPAYTKYLTQSMRQAFGYEGCSINLVPRARPKTITPFRRPIVQKKTGRKHARH
jgi:GTPase